MGMGTLSRALAASASLVLALAASGQLTGLNHTRTVDQAQDKADAQTIQQAIADVITIRDGDVDQRWTVLVFAGVYEENVSLGDDAENISIVGVDPQGVIIAPASGNGITITSTDDTRRGTLISGLTIVTSSGHGIEIVKGGTPVPSGITIENVIVRASGTGKDGIKCDVAEDVAIVGCDVYAEDGSGILIGSNSSIDRSRIEVPANATARAATRIHSQSKVRIGESALIGGGRTLLVSVSNDIRVHGTSLVTFGWGGAGNGSVSLAGPSSNVRFQDCAITNDARGTSAQSPIGVFADSTGSCIVVLEGCEIRVFAGTGAQSSAACAQIDVPSSEFTFINCVLEAHGQENTEQYVAGIRYAFESTDATPRQIVVGGSIRTVSMNERLTRVYDIQHTNVGLGKLLVSGCTFSKWRGPILSAARPQPTSYRALGIAAAAGNAVLAATSLTGSEQVITTGITSPDVYRVLSVTGSTAIMNQSVYIIGTNWADEPITDRITLNGTATVPGVKPFKTVTKIILPGSNGPSQSVSVGTTKELGLPFPIASSGSVVEWSKLTQISTTPTLHAYVPQSIGNLTVDATFSTVEPGTLASGDSLEFVVLASQ